MGVICLFLPCPSLWTHLEVVRVKQVVSSLDFFFVVNPIARDLILIL